MNIPRICQVGALLLIEAVQIGNMLKIVCVKFAGLHHQIRLYIIVKFRYLKLVSVFLQNRLRCSENLCVGCGGGCYRDGLTIALGDIQRGRALLFRCCTCSLSALDHQGIFIVFAVGIQQCRLIICVEEVLFSEGDDLLIQPVEQGAVALGDGRRNRILAAQGRNADHIAFIFQGKCDHFCVVICPGDACAILKGSFCRRVGVKLLKFDLRVVLGQIGLGGGSGDHDNLVIRADLVQALNHMVLMGNNAQRYIHIGKGEVHRFRSLFRHREVCQDDIHLAGLQILHAACCLCGDIIDLHAQVFADTLGKVHVIALVGAVLIHIAKGILVGEYAYIDGAALPDLIQGPVDGIPACFGRIRR